MLLAPMTTLRRSWADGARVERLAYRVAVVLIVSGLVHLGVLVVSGGSWTGPLSMRKPTTFGLSFGLTLASVCWATSLLALPARARTALLGAYTAASVVEVALVTMQAWRGVPSHFNYETGFDTAVSMTLAAGGVVLVATVLGWTSYALRRAADAAPSLRLALRSGFVLLVVALGVGAAMIVTGVTTARTDQQLAYTTAGALKPAHAVAMHAVLVLPLLAWLLTFTAWPQRVRSTLVRVAVGGYALLTGVVLAESIAHVSPVDAPLPAEFAAGLGLGAVLAVGVVTLYGVLRRPD